MSKTSFTGKKTPKNNTKTKTYNFLVGKQGLVPAITSIHTNVTKSQHDLIVLGLRTFVDRAGAKKDHSAREDFQAVEDFLPIYLRIGFYIYDKSNSINDFAPSSQRPILTVSQINKMVSKFFNGYLDQCTAIIPIVFADEKGEPEE